MDQTTPEVNLEKNLSKNSNYNHLKTKIVIFIIILIVVSIFGYLFFKNKKTLQPEERIVTNEERLKMLERLDVTPEDQKKNELSIEEKNKFIESIPDAGVYKKSDLKSKEEIEKILNATN